MNVWFLVPIGLLSASMLLSQRLPRTPASRRGTYTLLALLLGLAAAILLPITLFSPSGEVQAGARFVQVALGLYVLLSSWACVWLFNRAARRKDAALKEHPQGMETTGQDRQNKCASGMALVRWELSCVLSSDDASVAFAQSVLGQRRWFSAFLWVAHVMNCAIAVAFDVLIVMILRDFLGLPIALTVGVLGLVLVILFVVRKHPVQQYLRFMQRIARTMAGDWTRTLSWTIGDDGIVWRQESPSTGQFIAWESILRVDLTDDYVLLKRNESKNRFCIPKRAFNGDDDVRHFVEYARERMLMPLAAEPANRAEHQEVD
ncbi:MAG: YcxB family protein [Coriobacteriia bacterium]